MPSTLDFPNKSHRFSFIKPERSSELAEFCGIMLGDGGISQYQANITLGFGEEEYGEFVINLIRQLFLITPGSCRRKNSRAFTIFISRIGIVEFLVEECGLKLGNKVSQCVDIPSWIMEEERYKVACLRGLVDTDGSVFNHRYVSRGKIYSYKKLSFTSMSDLLLHSVLRIFREQSFTARIGSAHDVRLDSKSDMGRYFEVVGFHNPKHLKRYLS